ncbi:predicted protein [Chaetoceros tenuissimus]|uniref:Uncharacterized protein n=1 Tax=Chaetoceros tenuissimus TaxID=426638 RepID=A0AAD3H387_9STRA|nr:predicted protein [Chaetoceros tenuissimus]
MEAWNNHQNKKTAGRSDQFYIQFGVVSTKEFRKMFDQTFQVVFNESELDNQAIAWKGFEPVCLKSDLFRGWNPIRRNNLQKQMEQMNLGQSYTAFVQNALQFFCNKSLQNTHRIVVYMRMGKEIGQISQLLEYKVVTIAEFINTKKRLKNLLFM